MKNRFKGLWYALLGTVFASIYPLVVLWMNNVNQIPDISGIIKTMGIMTGGALLLLGLLLLLLRNAQRAATGTILIVILFTNGAALQDAFTWLVPSMRYWHTATLLILIAAGCILLAQRLPRSIIEIAAPVLTVVFGIMIVLNVAMAAPYLLSSPKGTEETKQPETLAASSSEASGRNAYWLLFDEYSSNYEFEEYFGFDNTPFTDWLEEKGFSVSYTSENESDKTAAITANIANLDYVAAYSNERTLTEDWDLILQHRKNAVLIPLLESYGYDIIGIGSADFYGFEGESVAAQASADITMNGDDTVSLFWKRTAIGELIQSDSNSQAEILLSQLQYLQNPENIPQKNTFVLSHINSPHTPFLFDKDGNLLSSTERINGENYLGQCEFINSQIKEIVETILENDPNALIAIVSDHGRRDGIPFDVRRRIFAALYSGEEKINIEGMSGINIMITMLNTILNTDIEPVPFQVMEEVVSH